ncbi:MAG: TetR/AcrR family transcriptional regulator [Proteobacteria bacterium]|nr:TetR/AcrR family transcriptional regulator [Pseudomonadota bacterium]
MTRDPRNTQDRILSAASQIVSRDGAGHLTLDAVAAESSLSKGGVLYHFPNKKALVQGMLTALMDQLENRRDELAEDLTSSNDLLRGFVLAENEQIQADRGSTLAILAAAAEDPTLLAPARDRFSRWMHDMLEKSADPTSALILILAVEGLRFMDTLSLLELTDEQRALLLERLLQETRQ